MRIVQRDPELTASRLLQDKVNNDPDFVVHRNTEVVELTGKGKLESVRLRDRATGEEQVVTPRAAFVFIGLDPNTAFLRGIVDLDAARVRRRQGRVHDVDARASSSPATSAAARPSSSARPSATASRRSSRSASTSRSTTRWPGTPRTEHGHCIPMRVL